MDNISLKRVLINNNDIIIKDSSFWIDEKLSKSQLCYLLYDSSDNDLKLFINKYISSMIRKPNGTVYQYNRDKCSLYKRFIIICLTENFVIGIKEIKNNRVSVLLDFLDDSKNLGITNIIITRTNKQALVKAINEYIISNMNRDIKLKKIYIPVWNKYINFLTSKELEINTLLENYFGD